MRLHDVVGREARHQGHGYAGVERLGETPRLVELDGQEAAPVDRLGDGLDPAAEAGRHPAGEDDHRDLPLAQRGSPRLDGPLEARVARRGEGGEIRR